MVRSALTYEAESGARLNEVPAVDAAVTIPPHGRGDRGCLLADRAVSAYAPVMQSGTSDKVRFAERAQGFEAFARWEAAHPPAPRSLTSLLCDLESLLCLMPESKRRLDPDATKSGVRRMHAALAVLTPRGPA
jgi:hypothetical protein